MRFLATLTLILVLAAVLVLATAVFCATASAQTPYPSYDASAYPAYTASAHPQYQPPAYPEYRPSAYPTTDPSASGGYQPSSLLPVPPVDRYSTTNRTPRPFPQDGYQQAWPEPVATRGRITAPSLDLSSAGTPRPGDAGTGNAYLDAMNAPWTENAKGGRSSGKGRWGIGGGKGGGVIGSGGKGPGGCSAGGKGCFGGHQGGCGGKCGRDAIWFGSVAGLIMNRDDENPVFFSFDTVDESEQLMKSRQGEWGYGYDVRIGRTICSCAFAWEAVYWGVFTGMSEQNLYAADMVDNLYSTYDFGWLTYDNGVDPPTEVNNFYDGAQRHRLRRDWEVHNLELNLWHMPFFVFNDCDRGNAHFGCTVGFRYFSFDEYLQFATDQTGTVFGVDPEDELFYNIDVDNDLIGIQIGARGDYHLRRNLEFHAGMKAGLYNNHISHVSQIVGSNGAAYVGGGPNVGQVFDVHSNKNDVALLGELELGVTWRITPRFSAIGGYRAVAVTGVALTTNQIPYNFAGINDVEDIDSNGSLILHGGYFGGQFIW